MAYYQEDASLYSVELSRTFCYLVLGRERIGKSVFLRNLACAARDLGGTLYLVDSEGQKDRKTAELTGAEYLCDSGGLFTMVKTLIELTNERVDLRGELLDQSLEDEEIYEAIKAVWENNGPAPALEGNPAYDEIEKTLFDLEPTVYEKVRAFAPRGIILSGGPRSVYEEGAPQADAALFDLNVPVLGICYGLQVMTRHFGGQVLSAGKREYGHADIVRQGTPGPLFDEFFKDDTVTSFNARNHHQ